MEVQIASNFVIPGLDNGSVEIHEGSTIRGLLERISELSGERVLFFERGRNVLDPDDWEVDLNGTPHETHQAGLETTLKTGDVVAIRLLMVAGG